MVLVVAAVLLAFGALGYRQLTQQLATPDSTT